MNTSRVVLAEAFRKAHQMALKTSDFDYPLDTRLIAQQPCPQRGDSRLLVLGRGNGRLSDRWFRDLPTILRPGDVLVLNDTAVIPARFACRRACPGVAGAKPGRGGGRIAGLFLREQSPGRWEVMLRNAGRCRKGEKLSVEGSPDVRIEMVAPLSGGRYEVRVEPPGPALELLRQFGSTPLPPYIRRRGRANEPTDGRRYQTVYARRPGAVAAPTAGLHFTPELLEALGQRGIHTAPVTLHVGVGTFAPVKVADPRDHRMHAEWYELPAATAEAVRAARAEGRRVVAVGTTSLRALETCTATGELRAGSGWTELFLCPPAWFGVVDALITNFHLPRSTLLMLVAAFCSPGDEKGLDVVRTAYAHATARGYRFFSYGDAMLIE